MTKKIKYLFCITPGRSGTHYLAELAKSIENVSAYHEALPVCMGEAMKQFNEGNFKAMSILAKKKALLIKKQVRKNKVYFEASHFFIKGFGYFIPEYFDSEEIGVIILKRNKRDIAKSLIRSRGIPGKNSWTDNWYLNLGGGASDLELCYGYIKEIWRRMNDYMIKFPKINYVEVSVGDLNTEENVLDLFEDKFGLTVNRSILRGVINKIPYEVNQEFQEPSNSQGIQKLQNPDLLKPRERNLLLRKISNYFLDKYSSEIKKRKHFLVFNTYLPEVISIFTKNEVDICRKFGLNLPQTQFEMELVRFILKKFRRFDPFVFILNDLEIFNQAPLRFFVYFFRNFLMSLGRI